jgi:hypothetical protein
MNGLERLVFEQSATHLLNKHNGVLVIDDELISSRASDVEAKTISNRKAGKEGPVADCVSCSVTNMLYGVRLRVKGERQSDNVEELMKTLRNPQRKQRCTFDRGYGKMDFVRLMVELGFEIATFATTIGSRHPFIPKLEADAYKMRLMKKDPTPSEADVQEQMDIFNNWVFDEDDYLGVDTRTAFKTLPNGTRIYASVVREIFDKKAESKTLRFFYSGPPGHEVGSFGSKWIAIKKPEAVPPNTLFHGNNRSARQVPKVSAPTDAGVKTEVAAAETRVLTARSAVLKL